jgi:hypothetical protein
MKSDNICKWFLLGAIALVAGRTDIAMTQAARAQDIAAEAETNDPFSPRRQPLIREGAFGYGVIQAPQIMIDKVRVSVKDAIRQASEKLRDAEGDEARSEAEAELRNLLDQYFDDDLERREGELKEMEDRLAKLEQQLERRKSKKDEIVDLQVKVLVNQAHGLGFFTDMPGDAAAFGAPQTFIFPGRELNVKTYPRERSDNPYSAGPKPTRAPVPTPAKPTRPVSPPRPADPAALGEPATSAETSVPTTVETAPDHDDQRRYEPR